MNMKRWGIVVVAGFGTMLLSSFMLQIGLPRILAQGLVVVGAVVFFGGMIGIIAHSIKHPPLRCPACGTGLNSRHLRQPGGSFRLTGRESVQCPRCGAMFLPQMMHRDLE